MTVIMRWSHAEPGDSTKRADLPCPMLIRDIPEYRSPIDGRLITSNSQRREDLKRNDCVDARELTGMNTVHKREKGYRNPEFCKKHGKPLNEEARAKMEGK